MSKLSAYTFEELVQIRKEQRATIKRLEQENAELRDKIDSMEFDLEELADYLIENASEAFEHQDRELLIGALKRYVEGE